MNHKNHGAKNHRTRHAEAVERNIEHAQRTPDQQLALIERRPGNSTKEKERLEDPSG